MNRAIPAVSIVLLGVGNLLMAESNPPWTPVQVPLDEVGSLDRAVAGGDGRIALLTGRNAILFGENSGATWARMVQDPAMLQVNSVAFLGNRLSWEVGTEGKTAFLASTSDGGLTWTRALTLSPSRPSALVDVRFFDPGTGIAVGNLDFQSAIAVTHNSGRSWQLNLIETDDPDPVLRRVCFRSRSEAWAVGGSSIYVSRDGGLSWALAYQGSGVLLSDIAITESSGIFVVGGFGEILHSPDYGVTWEKVAVEEPLAGRFLWSIAFADSERGWVAGNEGTIASTADGGRTWLLEETNQHELIRDVIVWGNRIFAVGDNGLIIQRRISNDSR